MLIFGVGCFFVWNSGVSRSVVGFFVVVVAVFATFVVTFVWRSRLLVVGVFRIFIVRTYFCAACKLLFTVVTIVLQIIITIILPVLNLK